MIDLHGFGDQLLQGAIVTLELAMCSLFVGLVLGLLGASAKLSSFKVLRWIAHGYTTIIRGIPELLTVLIIYFGATSVLMAVAGLFGYDEYIEVGAFAAGVTALGLTFGAYATEVFHDALQSIPKGQHEAATALGMGPIRKILSNYFAAGMANCFTWAWEFVSCPVKRYGISIGCGLGRYYA